eukprot:Blabericola_migrator_1__5254@NODE_26_length_20894_cov_127_933788_g23_i0_p7_GENE_NODE_26_length_20894_cov_127_933788_g23_i0NODE_26_length_20894_cov_127_933788_g23_i0_p7_ORF_typecomplete_len517_score115_33ANAPC4_WD40/PF12894_7/1_8e05ANAPC4_WD40/PF12894_7/0_0084ANAPC4_WD40/PF12894_7/0_084ANAPC4_WD40/PF12894_7/11ANAPC4_WD40/PF12894_7/0_53WD40_like/PF17005_5/2_8e10WD40_like/PF17005_5/0_13WD40/PF00400_32/28WD40/PF00400_32/4_9e02WD40/PF00400_32/0_0065WD40/PF00400_32/2_3e02WD40/PF00400_32/0_067WD40/PF00
MTLAGVDEVALSTAGEIRFFQNRIKRHTEELRAVRTHEVSTSAVTNAEFSVYDVYGELPIDETLATAPSITAIVCGGPRVQILTAEKGWEVEAEITDFQDIVHSCTLRDDGKLLITADATGQVRIIKTDKRMTLRNWKAHKAAARCAIFLQDRSKAMSVGDDQKLHVYDLTEEAPIATFKGIHTDITGSCRTSTLDENLALTGSLDGSVKVWDLRLSGKEANVMTFSHGAGVQCAEFCVAHPVVMSGGGSVVKFWDMRQVSEDKKVDRECSEPLSSRIYHLGAISDLKIVGDDEFVLSASSDKTVKLVTMQIDSIAEERYEVKRSILFEHRVTACAVSRNRQHFIAGCENGELIVYEASVRKKRSAPEEDLPEGSATFFKKGWSAEPKEGDIIKSLDEGRKSRFPPDKERLLRWHRYQESVKSTVADDSPESFFVLIRELSTQGSLTAALRGYTEDEAKAFIDYMNKHISNLQHDEMHLAHSIALKKFIGERLGTNELFYEMGRRVGMWACYDLSS